MADRAVERALADNRITSWSAIAWLQSTATIACGAAKVNVELGFHKLRAGHKQLFQGLWIEDKIDWQPHPVLAINFNNLDYREQPLASVADASSVRI